MKKIIAAAVLLTVVVATCHQPTIQPDPTTGGTVSYHYILPLSGKV